MVLTDIQLSLSSSSAAASWYVLFSSGIDTVKKKGVSRIVLELVRKIIDKSAELNLSRLHIASMYLTLKQHWIKIL